MVVGPGLVMSAFCEACSGDITHIVSFVQVINAWRTAKLHSIYVVGKGSTCDLLDKEWVMQATMEGVSAILYVD